MSRHQIRTWSTALRLTSSIHKTPRRCRVSVGSSSAALVQHRQNKGLKSCVCRAISILFNIVAMKTIPANTKHRYNIHTTSYQRIRHCYNIAQKPHKGLVSARMLVILEITIIGFSRVPLWLRRSRSCVLDLDFQD